MTTLERPTAEIRRVDLSTPHQRSSAAPEASLFRGYSSLAARIEERPCVCGGIVKANPLSPANGVAAHQFKSRHMAWREAHDL